MLGKVPARETEPYVCFVVVVAAAHASSCHVTLCQLLQIATVPFCGTEVTVQHLPLETFRNNVTPVFIWEKETPK